MDEQESADQPIDDTAPTARTFRSVSPADVASLESTFGLDIDGDGRIAHDVPAANDPVDERAATPATIGSAAGPFMQPRRRRRWAPLLIGIAIGAAMATWYLFLR
jgi:hypothetical protein